MSPLVPYYLLNVSALPNNEGDDSVASMAGAGILVDEDEIIVDKNGNIVDEDGNIDDLLAEVKLAKKSRKSIY
jgi:hypothetical protein